VPYPLSIGVEDILPWVDLVWEMSGNNVGNFSCARIEAMDHYRLKIYRLGEKLSETRFVKSRRGTEYELIKLF